MVLAFLFLQRATDLTFVRHAETLANATGRYNSRTLDTFSPLGLKEVEGLTRELEGLPRFPLILVSPSPRALRTIAPYLRATHQKATVWPELYECCTGRRPSDAHSTKFSFGSPISIPKDLAGLFVVLPASSRFPNSPDYDAGLAQVDAAVAEFRQRYSGGRVLLVGHSAMGGHFLHELTGKWMKVDNAKPIHLRLP